MINVILFDDYSRTDLLPFTYTKPVCELRFGILTIKEKWDLILGTSCSYQTENYLSNSFLSKYGDETIFINGKITPNAELIAAITNLELETGLKQDKDLIAFKTNSKNKLNITSSFKLATECTVEYLKICFTYDIFKKNAEAISADFELLTKNKKSQPLSSTNILIGNASKLFIEEGVSIQASILNTTTGCIYLAKDSEVMEGSAIRGPFALGEHSALKLNTKIYGATTIGPHCKVGGEVNNSVIFGYSNKAHDGFLGNSVIGEWCNLGADTNNSNLKNNYGNVKLYNYTHQKMLDTQLQFCGLMMGDHSKCGINTMFNTGTVVGVGANIFGSGFPPNHLPSFSWGGAEATEIYLLDKMIETAHRVYARRELILTRNDITVLTHIFNETKKFREHY